jgi:hypothetical protein
LEVDPIVSDGVELETDCREAGFMMKNSSTMIAMAPATKATRAATLNSGARRSKSRGRLAGSLIAFGPGKVGWDRGTTLIRSDLAACEAVGSSFDALSLNERGE